MQLMSIMYQISDVFTNRPLTSHSQSFHAPRIQMQACDWLKFIVPIYTSLSRLNGISWLLQNATETPHTNCPCPECAWSSSFLKLRSASCVLENVVLCFRIADYVRDLWQSAAVRFPVFARKSRRNALE
jgi:hypothetical protein